MADIFLDSTAGSDANDGSTRALAKATLAAALTAAGAGGRVGVRATHAESQASAMTLTSPGTAASPTSVLCIDWSSDTLASNALTTGASVATTGANSITPAGHLYGYGFTLSAGSTNNSANIQFSSSSAWAWTLDACRLVLNNTNTGSVIQSGVTGGNVKANRLVLNNTTLQFGSTSQFFRIISPTYWRNTASALQGGTVPTALFNFLSGTQGYLECVGVDLSAAGSGKTLVTASADIYSAAAFLNCKLGASVGLTTGAVAGPGGVAVRLVNCDSGDTNYRYQLTNYQGTITNEATVVRTGGASDGTNPFGRKLVSSANAKWYAPLETDPILLWNETVGSSVTVTVEVVTDGVTLTDAECWLDVQYLGTSGFPLAAFAADRSADVLATGANQTSSSATWTTTGLSSPTKQKLEVTFTPQEKGWVSARVMLAKASTTVYVDPVMTAA